MSRSRGGSAGLFFGGFVAGIILVSLMIGVVGMSILKNPYKMAGLAKRFGVATVVEKTVVKTVTKTVQSIPRGEIAVRQERLNSSFQHLTQAYSENRLTFEDIEKLGDRFSAVMTDRNVNAKELDDLLALAETLGQ